MSAILVFDVHWLVNGGYHINCNKRFAGIYTSNELPHFYSGHVTIATKAGQELGRLIAEMPTSGWKPALMKSIRWVGIRHLVPRRYMNEDGYFQGGFYRGLVCPPYAGRIACIWRGGTLSNRG